ncbi:RdgB/HAM1 family non-canonical purine NTP pyrophosphatase [uncultured Amnibacterium sp.]|uniref:RdgB/HAM1 family non-canonical purine NTP pyrophosphatase n=1 Tax=uncultured Amnibacterium sp. TaxID=1631851 RepID=UPI0035CB9546
MARFPAVVLATGNAHKVLELRAILAPLLPDLQVLPYDGPSPVEDGDTFQANALIKARAAALGSGLPAIADDSGIAVQALGGAPGLYSARFAGTGLDADNRALLLTRMQGIADRRARFVCAACLVVPAGGAVGEQAVRLAEWPGHLLGAERGGGGFGYDPLFVPDGETRTAAELTADEKNAVSHRARAFRALAEVLRAP